MNLKLLDERRKAAVNNKDLWYGTYTRVYEYVLPTRDAKNLYGGYFKDAKLKTLAIYDTTAMYAADQRANDFHSLIIPPGRSWGKLEPHPLLGKPDMFKTMNIDGLNAATNTYINDSNLASAAGSALLDLNIGTGALWVDSPSDDEPLLFHAIPELILYPEFTSGTTIKTAWFKRPMLHRKIIEEFEYKGAELTKLQESPDEISLVWYGQVYDETKKNYYYYATLDCDPETPLFQYEKKYLKLVIFRDKLRPGEVQGRGAALAMLPTVILLNNLMRDYAKSMNYKAFPPFFYEPSSGINPHAIESLPGSYWPMNGGRIPLQAMQMPEAPEISPMAQDLRNQIKQVFQVDPLGDITTATKSATEMSIRDARAQRTSSTSIARLINELPKSLYNTVINILFERDLLKNYVSPAFDPNTSQLRFSFQSPLFEIEQQQKISDLEHLLQLTQQYYGEGAVMAATNAGEVLAFAAKNLNLDGKLVTPPDALNSAISQIGKQAANAQGVQPQATAQTFPTIDLPHAAV